MSTGLTERRPGAGPFATWRDASGPARALILGALVNRMAGFLQIFVVLYLTGRGFSAAQAGGALSAYGAGIIVGLLTGGGLADRIGIRRTIVWSMCGSAALLLAILYLNSYPAIVAAVGLVGAVSQAYRPAAADMLSRITPPDRQVMIFSMQQLALNVGATSAPLVGIALISVSYSWLFWGEAGAAVLYALIAWRVLPAGGAHRGALPQPAGGAGPGPRDGQARDGQARDGQAGGGQAGGGQAGGGRRLAGYGAVFRNGRYLLFLAAMLGTALVYAQYLSTLPLYLRGRGLPTAVYGGLLALNSVLVILAQLPVTKVVQSWQPRLLAVSGILMTGGGMALYGPSWGLAGLVAATVLWSLAECVSTPTMFFAYPAEAAPPGQRGRYIGASQAAFHLGYAIGPTLGILMWRQAGAAVWAWAGAVSVIAAVAARAGVRPRAAHAPAASLPAERS